jgi:anti-sigma regulatory factor (Ser/Thr protein kinase)
LLNVAFAGVPGFWLLCPYDTSALDDSVLQEALQSHGFVSSCGQSAVPNRRYAPDQADRALWRDDLVPAPAEAQHLEIDATCIASARKVVQARAYELGLSERLAGDFALAVHEVVANSLKHGTGRGDMSMWESNESIVCEVRDGGRFAAPLAGRQRPIETGDTGRGLWMANQLCDLVQIRAGQGGTVVRLHMHKPSAGS